ncbi:MAG: DNA-3-methyladenine glycosylase [Acidimicrobiales bacterium]
MRLVVRLSSEFFARPPEVVAPELLGTVVTLGDKRLQVTELEAYGGNDDPASHAYRGPTPRNAAMFAEPGSLYVYLSYGVHFCVNLVAHGSETAGAILIRSGIDLCAPDEDSSGRVLGPGRVGRFFDVTRAESGLKLNSSGSSLGGALSREFTCERSVDLAGAIVNGPRVGISHAVDWPWRFWLSGTKAVSVYRRPKVRRTE